MIEPVNSLSKEEIEKLFKFVKSKYVHYIDVQYEIVDHLASAIEELQDEDSSLSFDSALQKVYGRFPITVFVKFVQAKSSAMTKFWRRRIFSYILTYFTLPKIIVTAALSYFYFVIQYYYEFTGWWTSFDLFLIPGLLVFAYFMIKMRPNSKELEKYLVLQSYYGIVWTIIWAPMYLLHMFSQRPDTLGFYTCIILSFAYALFNILWYASLIVFPKMLKEEIHKNYSHLNLA
jgi:hypothetical protein